VDEVRSKKKATTSGHDEYDKIGGSEVKKEDFTTIFIVDSRRRSQERSWGGSQLKEGVDKMNLCFFLITLKQIFCSLLLATRKGDKKRRSKKEKETKRRKLE
jgi:hypothetical protein